MTEIEFEGPERLWLVSFPSSYQYGTIHDIPEPFFDIVETFDLSNADSGLGLLYGNTIYILTDANVKKVIFICALATRNYIVEIYNVAVDKDYRRLGYATRALKAVIASHEPLEARYFWVGVINFDIVGLYLKLGFGGEKITNESPIGRRFNFDFVSLSYYRESNKTNL